MRINLGCGSRPEIGPGWLNHDWTLHSDHVDVAWNLMEMPWPGVVMLGDTVSTINGGENRAPSLFLLPEGIMGDDLDTPIKFGPPPAMKFDMVKTRDVVEHIPPNLFFPFANQVWDMLEPGGIWEIQVPEWGSPNAVTDPTHWRGFALDSFDILDPETKFGVKNHFYTNKRWKLKSKTRVPRSHTNLAFVLEKRS